MTLLRNAPRLLRRMLLTMLLLTGIAVGALLVPVREQSRIQNAVLIQREPSVVFEFVTTPRFWPRWHASSLAVSGTTDHSLAAGERVVEDIRVAGHQGRAHWVVLERRAPRRWVIDGALENGQVGRLTYTLTPTAAGTRFERAFVYPSQNLLFAIVNRVYLRATVERESAQALQRLKQVLEGARS